MSKTAPDPLKNLIITVPLLSEPTIQKFKDRFQSVHLHPDGKVPSEVAKKADVWFASFTGFPESVKVLEDIPRLKLLQVISAGAGQALAGPVFKDEKAFEQIVILSTSGLHVRTIPLWIVSHIISLSQNNHIWAYRLRNEEKWVPVTEKNEILTESGFPGGLLPLAGRTAGMLGYGHIARETARLLKAFGVEIIAANSSGKRKPDEGYVVPGTGDLAGSLPTAYYSTTDPESFDEFLSKSDYLIGTLPSTPDTHYMLKKKHFDTLPKYSMFVNVGRGDLVESDVLLAALNEPNPRLIGIALDVTDPEPLPDKHPLYAHPRVIITPHSSGGITGYNDRAADVLFANLDKWDKGEKLLTPVDPKKGY